MNSKILLGLVVVVVLGVGGYFLWNKGQRGTEPKGEPLTVNFQAGQVQNFEKGQKAPDVQFVDFNGKIYKLSDYRGKAVVLDFWAAWCPFCIEEMPELQRAQNKYKDSLVMIGIHRTDTEKPDAGLKFAKERGVSYLLVADTNGSLYRAAGGFGMPVAVFIDGNGVVQEVKSGPKTVEEIKEKVEKLVGGS